MSMRSPRPGGACSANLDRRSRGRMPYRLGPSSRWDGLPTIAKDEVSKMSKSCIVNSVCLFVAFLGAGLFLGDVWGADPNNRDKFLKEYGPASARLETVCRRNGKGQAVEYYTLTKKSHEETKETRVYEWFVEDGSIRLDEEIRKDTTESQGGNSIPPTRLSRVASHGRYFVVTQKDVGGPYVLNRLNEGESSLLTLKLKKLTDAPILLLNTDLMEFMKDPSIIVDGIEEESVQSGAGRRVTFHRAQSGSAKTGQIVSGWLLVNPDRGWVLEKYHVVVELSKRRDTYDCTIDYRPDEKIGYAPNRMEVVFENPTGGIRSVSVTEFKSFVEGGVPEREFSLAAFGLPEVDPLGGRRYFSRSTYWLLGAAFAALVVAVSLKFLASRLGGRTERSAHQDRN